MESKNSKLSSINTFALVAFLIFLPTFVTAAEKEIDVGEVPSVKTLFSFPNIGHEDQTLKETVQHYLTDSMKRENLGNYKAKFYVRQGKGRIKFSGPNSETVKSISKRYESYFRIGKIGILEFNKLKSDASYWHPKWQFLLPQGIAIENAKVIEIMDFPPITLISKQDYLDSRTTSQWWSLLDRNGVKDSDKPLYSSILDIVLVAAPASHGKKLREAGIYDGHFPKYTDAMLKLLSNNTGIQSNRPLLALGYPIREWIKTNWDVDIKVNEVALLEISPGVVSPVIGGNHPAYYLRSRGSRGRNSPIVRAILRQDLITAAWAAKIGENPDADPIVALKKAKSKWRSSDSEAYMKVLEEAGVIAPTKEIQLQQMRDEEPTEEQLLILEKEFYDKDYNYDEKDIKK